MLEIGLFSFLVSGAFLELANFDLFYQAIACVALLKILYWREVVLLSSTQIETSPPPEQVALVEA
jgi:hypothetical protein